MKGRLLFLGTGASTGTPVIGCSCAVCRSDSSCNRRLRPSALVDIGGKRLLVDCGPDFREQALKFGIVSLDALFLTHHHYDHMGGVDELRVFSFGEKKEPIPCFLSEKTFEALKQRCPYLMQPFCQDPLPWARLEFFLLEKERMEFQGIEIGVVRYLHKGSEVTGFRFGTLAYLPDMGAYSNGVIASLRGTEVLIADALKEEKSEAHLSLEEAIEFAKRVGAKRTYFTHIAHEMDHLKAGRRLPEKMELAYDGLEVEFSQTQLPLQG
ncbi:MAG: hypothetical protein A3G30_05220, partial [Chlamydiae bacterium RIFCSPLOWO2_12_FULL_49_12]